MRIRNTLWAPSAAAAAMLAGASTLAATDDGFSAFWKSFAAAAATDGAQLATMVVMGPRLGDEASFAQVHAHYLTARARRCLSTANPKRDVDGNGEVNYSVFCGATDYVFYKTKTGWKLTDIGAND